MFNNNWYWWRCFEVHQTVPLTLLVYQIRIIHFQCDTFKMLCEAQNTVHFHNYVPSLHRRVFSCSLVLGCLPIFVRVISPHWGNHTISTSRWRHNGRDSVSNHQPYDCLLNRLFRRRSKKISKLRVTGLCTGISLGTGEFPVKWPVTRKMFTFDHSSSVFVLSEQSFCKTFSKMQIYVAMADII